MLSLLFRRYEFIIVWLTKIGHRSLNFQALISLMVLALSLARGLTRGLGALGGSSPLDTLTFKQSNLSNEPEREQVV